MRSWIGESPVIRDTTRLRISSTKATLPAESSAAATTYPSGVAISHRGVKSKSMVTRRPFAKSTTDTARAIPSTATSLRVGSDTTTCLGTRPTSSEPTTPSMSLSTTVTMEAFWLGMKTYRATAPKSDLTGAVCARARSCGTPGMMIMAPATASAKIPAHGAARAHALVPIVTSLGSPDVFSHRCLVLGDVSHFDMRASALGDACPISLDPVPVHESVHEIEQAANRDSGMQGRLVPPRREDRVGIGLRHACRRQRQLLHESENRPQLAVDGSGREILDQAVDRLRRDPEQFRRRAVAAVAILAGVERRHVCADQLPLGWRQRGRATQDRLGNADPMRVDLGIGGENVLGRRIRGHRGKERHFATSSTRGSHCRSMRCIVGRRPAVVIAWALCGALAKPMWASFGYSRF